MFASLLQGKVACVLSLETVLKQVVFGGVQTPAVCAGLDMGQ